MSPYILQSSITSVVNIPQPPGTIARGPCPLQGVKYLAHVTASNPGYAIIELIHGVTT
jgi:hypothetical protein